MNDSSSLRRERGLLALLGFVCLALVGGALYLQYAKHEDPCPLCIIQRYLFLLIALFAFLGAGRKGWGGIALFETLIAITAATGIAGAARHLYIQLNPGFSCGFDALQPVVDSLPPAHWLPSVFKVAGLCETVYPPILGILLPGWALIAFVLIFGAVVVSSYRRRARRRVHIA
ncbi:disulfide bond formation protein B [Trinickia soli]|jgi:disulfide bond formation protein DsbB|uniref:Disulfide bond formation protein B n=1 Tax=Trinickia soli TaxID=380675 RepID=A0A2N7VT42_9BURK|nr:disulfide bond formation protein B [Trinickia soli]KAA0088732.1 disulfide bond formation protein B [Paraburkholderia sp. T12-10]PMS20299.1 disulfide bond formation protein B [Trinickia soli]CAB3710421.1 Disulfide bond formation protein B [Trinickia soli]